MASLTINLKEVIIAYCSLELVRTPITIQTVETQQVLWWLFCSQHPQIVKLLGSYHMPVMHSHPSEAAPAGTPALQDEGNLVCMLLAWIYGVYMPIIITVCDMWYMMINDVHVYICPNLWGYLRRQSCTCRCKHSHIVYVYIYIYYDIRQDIFFQNFHNPSMEDM